MNTTGQLGLLVLGQWLLSKNVKKWGHGVSPPILSQNPHCSTSKKLPYSPYLFSCLHFDATGLRLGIFLNHLALSSLLRPGHRVLQRACHPPSLKHVTFIYLFLVSPLPMPAEAISGPRYGVLICGSASVFSIPPSHSPQPGAWGDLSRCFILAWLVA